MTLHPGLRTRQAGFRGDGSTQLNVSWARDLRLAFVLLRFVGGDGKARGEGTGSPGCAGRRASVSSGGDRGSRASGRQLSPSCRPLPPRLPPPSRRPPPPPASRRPPAAGAAPTPGASCGEQRQGGREGGGEAIASPGASPSLPSLPPAPTRYGGSEALERGWVAGRWRRRRRRGREAQVPPVTDTVTSTMTRGGTRGGGD